MIYLKLLILLFTTASFSGIDAKKFKPPVPGEATPQKPSEPLEPIGESCTTTYYGAGKCVPKNKCKVQIALMDRALGSDTPCPLRKMCCPDSSIVTDPSVPVTPTNPTKPTDPPVPATPSEPTDSTETESPDAAIPMCGMAKQPLKNSDVGDRIVNNDADAKTLQNEFPWVVDIVITLQDNSYYLHPGSLIHPSLVLTTAHKIYNCSTDQLTVWAGAWVHGVDSFQKSTIEEIKYHQWFNPGNLIWDIALIFLDQPMNINSKVNLACFPSKNDVRAPVGIRCSVVGWGKGSFNGAYTNVMTQVILPVVERETCQAELQSKKTNLTEKFRLHKSFMCAGGQKNRDACIGDGGSPLMCPVQGQTGRFVVAGMVSWGVGCGDDLPAVYTDIYFLREWIEEKLKEYYEEHDNFTSRLYAISSVN